MDILVSRGAGSRSAGKKILALNLIFAFLVSLVYINQPAFAAGNFVNNPAPAALKPNVTVKPLAVRVVPLPPAASIKDTSVSLGLSCAVAPIKASANLVQDEGLINLNQPANCFSLKPVSQAVAVENLKVENLNQTAKISIAYGAERLESPDLAPSPLSPIGLPSLPALSVMLAASALVFKKKITQKLLTLRDRFFVAPQAYGLEILRC